MKDADKLIDAVATLAKEVIRFFLPHVATSENTSGNEPSESSSSEENSNISPLNH